MTLSDCFALFVKFFFLLTPPFVMSAFLSVTKDNTIQERNTLAIWITLWILIISGVLLFSADSFLKFSALRWTHSESVRVRSCFDCRFSGKRRLYPSAVRRLRPVFSSCADGHSDHFGAGLYRCADGLRR